MVVEKPGCWLSSAYSLIHCGPKILKRSFLQIWNTIKGELMTGVAVAVLSEEELLGNTGIPILCNLWRKLILACSSAAEGAGSLLKPPAVESSLSRVSFNYKNQSLGLH